MGQGAGAGIDEADAFVIDGLEFVPSWVRPSQPGSLTLLKSIDMVELYRQLLEPYPNPRMVELGISQGGSVALLALLARPTKFLAVELASEPVDPLLVALRDRGLDTVVKPYFGMDQGDKERLEQLVLAEFGDEPLDVVIDDASHLYGPTVASFEVLFPRLRPGGVYVIEDWTCDDLRAKAMAEVLTDPTAPEHENIRTNFEATFASALADPTSPESERFEAWAAEVLAGPDSPDRTRLVEALGRQPDEPPPDAQAGGAHRLESKQVERHTAMSRIALELALARAHSGEAVAEVRLDGNWIVIRRGSAIIDPTGFRLGDLCPDHNRLLAPPAGRT